jgi:hypothetical protein
MSSFKYQFCFSYKSAYIEQVFAYHMHIKDKFNNI